MSGARLRRRLNRIAGSGLSGAMTPLIDPDYLEAASRWAGVSSIEVMTETRRIDALCRAAGAWTVEARLQVVAADGAISVEALRAEVADLHRTFTEVAAS